MEKTMARRAKTEPKKESKATGKHVRKERPKNKNLFIYLGILLVVLILILLISLNQSKKAIREPESQIGEIQKNTEQPGPMVPKEPIQPVQPQQPASPVNPVTNPQNNVVSPMPKSQGEVHIVQIINLRFIPRNLDILVGDTVRWINLDISGGNVRVHFVKGYCHENVLSQRLGFNETFDYTFNQTGNCNFVDNFGYTSVLVRVKEAS